MQNHSTNKNGHQKIRQGSNYAQHVGKRCTVNSAGFSGGVGKILSFDKKNKTYLVELDAEHAYLNPKTGKKTTWCRCACRQTWV